MAPLPVTLLILLLSLQICSRCDIEAGLQGRGNKYTKTAELSQTFYLWLSLLNPESFISLFMAPSDMRLHIDSNSNVWYFPGRLEESSKEELNVMQNMDSYSGSCVNHKYAKILKFFSLESVVCCHIIWKEFSVICKYFL